MLVALLIILLLSACASKGVFTPVEVKVPVSVPCKVHLPAAPAYHLPALPEGAGLLDKVKALIADFELKSAYELQLRAAAESCS